MPPRGKLSHLNSIIISLSCNTDCNNPASPVLSPPFSLYVGLETLSLSMFTRPKVSSPPVTVIWTWGRCSWPWSQIMIAWFSPSWGKSNFSLQFLKNKTYLIIHKKKRKKINYNNPDCLQVSQMPLINV